MYTLRKQARVQGAAFSLDEHIVPPIKLNPHIPKELWTWSAQCVKERSPSAPRRHE